jgi:hypothetical protein
MKAGLIALISEIKNQIKQIEIQIEAEQKIHAIYTKYKDCPMKTAVIHQSIGVVRGLEIAKESLEYILNQQKTTEYQMTTDEWMMMEERMKGIK